MVEKILVDKLPMLQKFLAFISKNSTALVIFLLFLSLGMNGYLGKKLLEAKDEINRDREKSVDYERERAKSYEDIIKEQVRQPKIITNDKDTLH